MTQKIFQYEAVDISGRRVVDSVKADSADDVRRQLLENNLVATKVQEKSTPLKSSAAGGWKRFFEKKLATFELILFTKQFRTLYVAGIPLAEIFTILHGQVKNREFKAVVGDIHRRILEGGSLTDAFQSHHRVFSRLYCAMIAAGETSGSLPDVLNRLSYIIERDEKTRQKIESALRYPKMVVIVMLGAFLVLLNFVIPQFSNLYASAKIELPLLTQIAIHLNVLCMQYWWLILAAAAGLTFAWKSWMRTQNGIMWRDCLALKIPVVGTLVQKAAISRFASIFSILQRSGLAVMDSMDIVRDTIDNAFFGSQFEEIKRRVRGGEGISSAIGQVRGFTPLAVSLMTVGESSGNLEEMMEELAAHYDNEVAIAVDELTDWIGPILIICLGVVVLFFALAIFLPMWDLMKLV